MNFMSDLELNAVTGIIRNVQSSNSQCCEQQITLANAQGITNIIIKPSTFVVGSIRLVRGMTVTVFFDANAPAPTIFPPQYNAVIIAQKIGREEIYAGYFDENLLAQNQALQLNLSPRTIMLTANGQRFTCSPGGHLLIVFYRYTTYSIPPQTTPHKIIVIC